MTSIKLGFTWLFMVFRVIIRNRNVNSEHSASSNNFYICCPHMSIQEIHRQLCHTPHVEPNADWSVFGVETQSVQFQYNIPFKKSISFENV